MAFKKIRVVYTAKNFATGLTDVKGNVFVNATATDMVGASALSFTELSATYAPGVYVAELDPNLITGVTVNAGDAIEVRINSASMTAPSTFKEYAALKSLEDISSQITSEIGAAQTALSGDIDAAEAAIIAEVNANEAKIDTILSNVGSAGSDAAAAKVAAEGAYGIVSDGTFGNAALKTILDTINGAVGQIQNNTRFSAAIPSEFVKPNGATPTAFRIYGQMFDTAGNPEDPDSNEMFFVVRNATGVEINSVFGLAAGPVAMTRSATGRFYADLSLASSANVGEIFFEFSYSENSIALVQVRASNIVASVEASGFASQLSVDAIQSDVTTIKSDVATIKGDVSSATYGLAALKTIIDTKASQLSVDQAKTVIDAIDTMLTSGTYGLAALKTLIDTKADASAVAGVQSTLNNASYGLAAIKAEVGSAKTDINNNVDAAETALSLILDAMKGVGFDGSVDSLKAMSTRVYTGGYAV